jgi:uncharacterized integral membrane protein (TIGR00698 family)
MSLLLIRPSADMSQSTHGRDAGGFFLSAKSALPGMALTVGIAGLAFALHQLPGVGVLSPLILAILLGIAFHNLIGTPRRAKAGVTFSLRRILRFAIILLGLQLTVAQVISVGGAGLGIIVATLVGTFGFTVWLGRRLGVESRLAQLIAAGTSICGASAVIASNTAIEGSDEDVAYAVACVTIFGSLSMFLYPLVPALLHLDAHRYGLWAGASIHEIAQVVAAAFQNGKEAGDFGTIAKLSRVTLLAPVVLALGWIAARRRGGHHGQRKAAPMPWFVLGFVGLILVNSLDILPAAIKTGSVPVTTFLLSVSLAAMGLETDIRKLAAKGLRPLLLGAGAWLFISAFSLGLIYALD